MDNPLARHPRLLSLRPGTTAFTEGLRALYTEIGAQHEPARQQWEALRAEHIGALSPADRHAHMLLLTPRHVLFGVEAMDYGLGILGSVGVGVVGTLLQFGTPDTLALIAAALGMGTMAVTRTYGAHVRATTARRLALTPPDAHITPYTTGTVI